jgi:hypothetical protein
MGMTTALSAQQALAVINEAKAHGFFDAPVAENDAQKIEVADGLVNAARNAFRAGVKATPVVNIIKIVEGEQPEVAATNPFIQAPTPAAAPEPEVAPEPVAEDTPPWEGPDQISPQAEPAAVDVQPEFNRQCKNQGCAMASGHTFMSNENCSMCGQPTVAKDVEPEGVEVEVTNVVVQENVAPSFDQKVELTLEAMRKGHTVMAPPDVFQEAARRFAAQQHVPVTPVEAQHADLNGPLLDVVREAVTQTTAQQLAAVEAAGTATEAPKRTRRVRHPETGDLITKEERDEYLRRQAAGDEPSEFTVRTVGAPQSEAQAITFENGAEIEIVHGTMQATSGPHPTAVHVDEVELMSPHIFAAARAAAEGGGPREVLEAAQQAFEQQIASVPGAVAADETELATEELTHAILENGELNAEEAIAAQQPIRGDFLGKRYRETELAQAAIAKANLPIPQDIEGAPLLLPSDFTTVDDVQIRRLHSSYHTYLARANWLLACEESDLDASQRLHDRRYYHVLSQLERAEGKNQERVTLLKAEASADDEVAKWRETIAEHSALVKRLKVLRDHYEGTCTRLSREWTMRTGERDTAGGLKRAA